MKAVPMPITNCSVRLYVGTLISGVACLATLTSSSVAQVIKGPRVLDQIAEVWRETAPTAVRVLWRSEVLHTQAFREAMSRSLASRSGERPAAARALNFGENHELLVSRGRVSHTIKGKAPVRIPGGSTKLLDRETVEIFDGPSRVFRRLDQSLTGKQYLNVLIDDMRDLFEKISLPDQPPIVWALGDPGILNGYDVVTVDNGMVTLVRHGAAGDEETQRQLKLDATQHYSLVSDTLRRRRRNGPWRVISSTKASYESKNGRYVPTEWLYQCFSDRSTPDIAIASRILGSDFPDHVPRATFNPKLPAGTMITDQRFGGSTRAVIDEKGRERIIPPHRRFNLTYEEAIDSESEFPFRYGDPFSRRVAVVGLVLGVGLAVAVAAYWQRRSRASS